MIKKAGNFFVGFICSKVKAILIFIIKFYGNVTFRQGLYSRNFTSELNIMPEKIITKIFAESGTKHFRVIAISEWEKIYSDTKVNYRVMY